MNKFHIDRLEKLYTFLGTVKAEKFNFGTWGYSETGKTELNVCGTTACALGWAASMPAFRKRGLRLEWDTSGRWTEDGEAEALVSLYQDGEVCARGEDAGAAFFGLTNEEANYLFLPEGYGYGDSIGDDTMSVKDYRKGLRKFIDKKKRELGYK